MTVLELVARTFSVQLPDGRLVFRPWGARGPCFLLSQQQRESRAWLQLVFYGLAIAALWFFPAIIATTSGLVGFLVAFTLLNYGLFWLFSIGLPKTERPPPLTPEQRRMAMAAHSRALGQPLLWLLAGVSWVFALAGGAMVMLLGEWATGLLVLVFFGACAALFTWQLWLVRRRGDA
jgi:hypothetical protein